MQSLFDYDAVNIQEISEIQAKTQGLNLENQD